MVEPTFLPASNQVSAEQNYRPLSLLAIAGLAISSAFAVTLLVVGMWALLSGSPFNLGFVWLLFPIFGFILSLAARWQIRMAEGTRAGAVFATIGIWLSVLSGMGYAAYAVATFFAIRQQAEEFLLGEDAGPDNGFLPKL